MGNKDKARDRDATTTDRDHRDSCTNRDHRRDQEVARDAVLARTITEAVAVALAKQKAEETVYHRSIYKANGEGTCTIQEAF